MKKITVYIPEPDLTLTCFESGDPAGEIRDQIQAGDCVMLADEQKGEKEFIIPNDLARKCLFVVEDQ